MIRLGSRGSRLAMIQARLAREALNKAGGGALSVEIVQIPSWGDLHPEAPIAQMGGKGVFSTALEAALLDGLIDVAVHSAKDMEPDGGRGLVLCGALKRDDPRDAILVPRILQDKNLPAETNQNLTQLGPSNPKQENLPAEIIQNLTQLGPSNPKQENLPAEVIQNLKRVGTSSPRRAALLRRFAPTAMPTPIRGNIDTRIKKLNAGQYDALILAIAGLKRFARHHKPAKQTMNAVSLTPLPETDFVPAAGQGIIALQTRADDENLSGLCHDASCAKALIALRAERAFIHALGAGCSTPVGAHARVGADRSLYMQVALLAPDGAFRLDLARKASASDAQALGRNLAEEAIGRMSPAQKTALGLSIP